MTFDVEVAASLPSTQDEVRTRLAEGRRCPQVLIALDQTAGRGRRERVWLSEPGMSLAMSVTLPEWNDHPRPWIPGMAGAIAVARALEARLQWPNDVVMGGKKVAGILVEQHPLPEGGSAVVVGVGVNLRQTSFPAEIAHRATSLVLEGGKSLDPSEAAHMILTCWEPLRSARHWADLEPHWMELDQTGGKVFRKPGGVEVLALRIGAMGELVGSREGKEESIFAAEAFFDEEKES